MATISSIVSKLTLDTSQFNTRLQRSRRRARNWGRDLSRIGRQVGKVVAAGTAVAAIGIAAMTRKQLESIDASAKFARSIDLQVEKLAGLRHAADLNGVGNDKFDKSLQRMVRSIGDANSRGGALAKVFDDLGVSSEELATKSPDEQLAILADAFSRVEDRTMAASAAAQIFGRDGVSLLNLLNQGSGALRNAQAEVDKYSSALTAVDAAAVEEAGDQFLRLRAKVNGVQQSITAGLAPYLTSTIDQILDIKTSGVETSDVISSGLRLVAKAVTVVANTVEVFKLAWGSLRTAAQVAVTGISFIVLKLSDALESVSASLGGGYETPQWLRDFVDESVKATEAAAEGVADTFNGLLDNKRGQEIDAFFDEIEKGAERARQAAKEAAEAANVEGALLFDDEQIANVNKITETLDDLQKQVDQFGLDGQQIKLFDLEALGASAEQIEKARAAMEQLRELEERRDRENSIASIVEQLEREVNEFGKTADELKIQQLRDLGATEEQIARAQAAIDARQSLEAVDTPLQQPSLIRAGSAAAQAAAFSAQRSVDPQLAEAKKQTGIQERVANGIERLVEQSGRVSTAPAVLIEEVGI